MATLEIPNPLTGDDVIEFDGIVAHRLFTQCVGVEEIPGFIPDEAIGLDPAAVAQVNKAMRIFNELVNEKKHVAGTRKTGERQAHKITSFNQVEDETTFILPRQGG